MQTIAKHTGIYRRSIEAELKSTLDKLGPGKSYEAIRKFAIELKVTGLSDHRVIFYFAKLRPIANKLGEKFLDPTEDDLKGMIESLYHTKLSLRSVEDYKQTLKKFYSWYLTKQKYNKACGWIKVKNNVDRHKKSEDMLTEEEVNQVIEGCRNLRDKAIVSLLYDSGCRIGELLTLKLKDVELDDNGMTLHVSGKTGERMVYVIGDSIAYLREWRKIHPFNSDLNSMLFVDLVSGEPMNYDAVRMTLNKAVRRVGIKKHVHIHLFRHSYATRYSEVLSESVLKAQLGWTASSRMAQKYVHLSGQQQKNAIRMANGLDPEVKTLKHSELRTCQRCGEKNPSTASLCVKCWFPLTTEASIELQKKQNHIESELDQKGKIGMEIKEVMARIPEADRTSILASIVEGLLEGKSEPKKNDKGQN